MINHVRVCKKDNGENTHTGTGGSMLIVSLERWNTFEIWLDHLFLLLSLFISFFHRSPSLHLSNISLVSPLSIFSRDITLQPSFISFSSLPRTRKLFLHSFFHSSPSLDGSNERALPELQLRSRFMEMMSSWKKLLYIKIHLCFSSQDSKTCSSYVNLHW